MTIDPRHIAMPPTEVNPTDDLDPAAHVPDEPAEDEVTVADQTHPDS